MKRRLVAGLALAALAAACGTEAPPPRDWRVAPFEPVADETAGVYALVIETGLAELEKLQGGKRIDHDPLDIRPVLAEQGRAPLPTAVRDAIDAHLDRNVRFLDPLQTGSPEGTAVFFGPIVLRGTQRHVFAGFFGGVAEYRATFVLEPRWRVVALKDENKLCPTCSEITGSKPVP